MNKEILLKKIKAILTENIDVEEISESDSFMDDLDMGSMEIFAFIGDLEYELNIRIPEKVLLRASTVGELLDEIIALKIGGINEN